LQEMTTRPESRNPGATQVASRKQPEMPTPAILCAVNDASSPKGKCGCRAATILDLCRYNLLYPVSRDRGVPTSDKIKIKRPPPRLGELWETRSVFQGLVGNLVEVVHQPGGSHRYQLDQQVPGGDREDLLRGQFVVCDRAQ
jgi:hypothetical protein